MALINNSTPLSSSRVVSGTTEQLEGDNKINALPEGNTPLTEPAIPGTTPLDDIPEIPGIGAAAATAAASATGATGSTGVTYDTNEVASLNPPEWTTPSWEQDSKEQAGSQLLQDVASAEESQLKSRQSIEKSGTTANTEYTMLNYQQNQNIEKMGWGGGSYHDAKMQEEYLKASIQADLYGQLELQKYGYETEIAKARAAYDANQKQLSMEYMKAEYDKAYNQAQITGVWIDPTIKDRLAQWDVAGKIMEENQGDPDGEAYQKAKLIRTQVLASMNIEGTITEQGVDVLRQILEQQNLYTEDTYTAAQIESLNVETDNAQALAEASLTEANEEKGLYSYTNKETGVTTQVDLFGSDWVAISALLAERPALKYEAIRSFSDTLTSEFQLWKTANGDTDADINDFIDANQGAFDSLLTQANAWAKKAGMDSFTFNGQNYTVGENPTNSTSTTAATTNSNLSESEINQVRLSYDLNAAETVLTLEELPTDGAGANYNAFITASGEQTIIYHRDSNVDAYITAAMKEWDSDNNGNCIQIMGKYLVFHNGNFFISPSKQGTVVKTFDRDDAGLPETQTDYTGSTNLTV